VTGKPVYAFLPVPEIDPVLTGTDHLVIFIYINGIHPGRVFYKGSRATQVQDVDGKENYQKQ